MKVLEQCPGAQLTVADRLRLSIAPPWAAANSGLEITYILTITEKDQIYKGRMVVL